MHLLLHYRVSAVYSQDHMADWKLWLRAAQLHKRVLYDLLVQKTSKIQNLKYGFFWMYIPFAAS